MKLALVVISLPLLSSLRLFTLNEWIRSNRPTSNDNRCKPIPICAFFDRKFHGIDNELNITSPALDSDDVAIDDYDDYELKMSMAQEQYDDLCDGKGYLTKDDFVNWDEVIDYFNDGSIDLTTLDFIFQEVGIFSEVITFPQFVELVDIINQVAAALSGESYDDEDEDEGDDNYNGIDFMAEGDPLSTESPDEIFERITHRS